MKAIVRKYNVSKDGEQNYAYKFEHNGKNYDHLFRNYGNPGKRGVISFETPEGIIEWFRDIEGDDTALAIEYDLIRANAAIEKCNKGQGCFATCDYAQKQKCDLMKEQTRCMNEKELTKQFIAFVLENGFEIDKTR